MISIPDYELQHKCGSGACGEVWIARNRAGAPVALKIVEKSEQVARELAGLRSYSRITDAPHLIRIFHIGEAAGSLYYTMELADNLGSDTLYIPATLTNLLARQKRLSPAETIELGQKLLQGLELLHRAGLIHRDIKPDNILYVNGEPKLSDVGLVRAVSQSLSLGGTLGFIPPERLKSGSSSRNNADDLYALGKVLYCCLTGNDVEDYPSFPPSLLSAEHSRLNEVILTACSRNVSLRFRTAGEFRRALTEGLTSRRRLWNKLFPWRYAGIGLLLLLGAGVWIGRDPRLRPSVGGEPPLEEGEIRNRTYFSAETDANDPDVDTSLTGYADPVFRRFSPTQLDFAPRRSETVFRRFAGKKWSSINSSNFWRSGNQLRIYANAEGGMRLMLPLDYAYAIRFEINYEKLEDLLIFQVAALNSRGIDRASYQWSLQKTLGKLTLKPMEYQAENGERKIRIKPVRQPPDLAGFHRVEMVQTSKIFRLYIDGELVLYAPSFFVGGYFNILAVTGNRSFVELKNFELLKIQHDPACPPEQQYQLPERR